MASVLLRSYMDCSGCVLLLSVCTMDEHLSRWQVVLGFAQVLPLRKWWSSWLELSYWNCWKYDSVCFTETLCTEEILFWDCKTRCVTSVQSFPLVLPPPNLTWQKHQFWLSFASQEGSCSQEVIKLSEFNQFFMAMCHLNIPLFLQLVKTVLELAPQPHNSSTISPVVLLL